MIRLFSIFFALVLCANLSAQESYWQQHVDYKMEVELNDQNHQLKGKQEIIYSNNSPENISEVFYHLYFNAFQPGSMMDVRSRTIEDPDSRVGDRISKLSENEIGYQKIISLKQDGKAIPFEVLGTILKAKLNKTLLPGKSTKLEMEFIAQVPLQIRRSGRDNKEGISYSMTQWYPKLSEFDEDGWHPNPYVGREFYGVWGNFDVSIKANKNLIIGGTGNIVKEEILANGQKLWKFKAENVHDFAWAADPDYLHDIAEGPNGVKLHFYYQNDEEIIENWKWVQDKTIRLFEIMNKTFGVYPYDKYSVIQGGDGGMEYPQATLITGKRSKNSLMGVIVHEVIHSWYQMILGTDEALYPWMDEGFTTFASSYVMNILLDQNEFNPHENSIKGYMRLAASGKQEPLATHADYFHTNFAYGVSSYSKGETFLWQLNYMLGDSIFYAGMLDYYNTWKFKHPEANDFIRIMERHCNCVLDWYKEGWVNTTNEIDYAIEKVEDKGKKTEFTIARVGKMASPIDVRIELEGGEVIWVEIPNYNMFADKGMTRSFKHPEMQKALFNPTKLKPWPWTHPSYVFSLDIKKSKIVSVVIDPYWGTADTDRENNTYQEKLPVHFLGN